jgi:hypothetical protein
VSARSTRRRARAWTWSSGRGDMDAFPLVVIGVMFFVWFVLVPKGGDDE